MANDITYYAFDQSSLELLAEVPIIGGSDSSGSGSAVKWGQRLNSAAGFSGVINLADHSSQAADIKDATSPGKSLLVVDVNGSIEFCGLFLPHTWTRSTRQMSVQASDAMSYLGQRVQAADYGTTWQNTPTDACDIAQQIVGDAMALPGTMGLFTAAKNFSVDVREMVANPNPIEVSYPISSLQTLESILSTLSSNGYMTGFDYAVDAAWANGPGSTPQLTLNISYPRRGRIAGSTGLVIEATGPEFIWTEDPTGQGNSLYGVSSGSSTYMVQVSDPAVTAAGYPLMELAVNYTQINTPGALLAASLGNLAQVEWPITSGQVTLPMFGDPAIGDFIMGDDTRLIVPKAVPLSYVVNGSTVYDEFFPDGLDTYMRIVGADFSVPDAGTPTMLIYLSTPPGIAPVPPPPL